MKCLICETRPAEIDPFDGESLDLCRQCSDEEHAAECASLEGAESGAGREAQLDDEAERAGHGWNG